jgi:hypothetical protein
MLGSVKIRRIYLVEVSKGGYVTALVRVHRKKHLLSLTVVTDEVFSYYRTWNRWREEKYLDQVSQKLTDQLHYGVTAYLTGVKEGKDATQTGVTQTNTETYQSTVGKLLGQG